MSQKTATFSTRKTLPPQHLPSQQGQKYPPVPNITFTTNCEVYVLGYLFSLGVTDPEEGLEEVRVSEGERGESEERAESLNSYL